MEKLQKVLESYEGAKILDVGTGVGNFINLINHLYQGYGEITGIDIHERSIEAAKKNFEANDKINIVKMDAFNMDYDDNTFDVVCLSNSLHHLEKRKEMLKEMKRVLKPGGILLFNEMVSDNLDAMQMSHLKLHHFGAEVDRENGVFHDLTYPRQQIIDILHQESGLEIKDAWDMNVERRKTNTKEELDYVTNVIDSMYKRVENSDRYEYFVNKGNAIKDYILKNGYDGATSLLVVLEK